ncbi:MAG: FecR domain-containing protein [Opitutaceae bacterium]|nr:FecR domain-containing protein [Opitutaceae bacterium]
MPDPIPFPTPEQITEAAARWIPRLDAGLTEEEEREFETWVEADARHAEVLERQQAVWNRFESLAHAEVAAKPDADRFAPRPVPARRRDSSWALWLAAAAAVAVGAFVWQAKWGSPAPVVAPMATVVELPPPLVLRTLPDGSVVGLNRGAEINVEYTATERRVALLRGEASFTVAKNAEVPFVVSAGGVRVRAVGTAFNVRFDPIAVEVVVSEGQVQVATPSEPNVHAPGLALPVLGAGKRASVLLTAAAPVPEVATLSPEQLDARLAWQPRLLDFDDAPLSEIVQSFNRHNPVRLVIVDPSIAALRLNASIRSDNLEGFVRLLESDFGIRMEKHGDDEIALRRVR